MGDCEATTPTAFPGDTRAGREVDAVLLARNPSEPPEAPGATGAKATGPFDELRTVLPVGGWRMGLSPVPVGCRAAAVEESRAGVCKIWMDPATAVATARVLVPLREGESEPELSAAFAPPL